MGQLGMQELILIFVVALLVFGPKKLPELGKSLGKGLREFKRATNDMKATWDSQLRDVEDEVRQTSKDLKKADSDLRRDIHSTPSPATPDSPTATPTPTGSVAKGTIQPPAPGGTDPSDDEEPPEASS